MKVGFARPECRSIGVADNREGFVIAGLNARSSGRSVGIGAFDLRHQERALFQDGGVFSASISSTVGGSRSKVVAVSRT